LPPKCTAALSTWWPEVAAARAAGRPTIRVTKARELFFGGPGGFNAFHAKATHAGSGLTAL